MFPDKGFVELVTARLVIRRLRLSDAARLAEYRNDPEVARYQSWATPFSKADAMDFIADMEHRHPGDPGEWFQFAIASKDSDILIGDCAVCCSRTPPWVAELGCSLSPAWQGRGHAGEAVRAVRDYALGTLGAEWLLAVADRRNAAARRLMESMGLTEGGRDHLVPPSGPLGEHEVMRVLPARNAISSPTPNQR